MNKRVGKKSRSQRRPPARQRGAALVLIVIAMLVLLLMAGMALDVGHMMLNKTRLQNAVDAAALSAAKTLDQTGSTTLATAAALQGLGLDANTPGDGELGNTYDGNNLQVTIQYSSTLPPFTPGSTTGPYVRVIATGFTFPTAFIEVHGLAKLGVSATAVAGPSPSLTQTCNVVPVLACGDQTQAPPAGDWGYQPGAPVVLKSAAGTTSALGPGNFQLLQISGNGDNIVRDNLAGNPQACLAPGGTAQTETGNGTGPVAQGLNTRLGIYSGPMTGTSGTYPPDVITYYSQPQVTIQTVTTSTGTVNQIWYDSPTAGNIQITNSNIDQIFNYSENDAGTNPYPSSTSSYESLEGLPALWNYQLTGDPAGALNRRVLTIPIGQCNGQTNGTGTVNIYGFGCFFMIQPVVQQGTSDYIVGEFLSAGSGNCDGPGDPGQSPNSGPGPYVIELYHNPGSPDS